MGGEEVFDGGRGVGVGGGEVFPDVDCHRSAIGCKVLVGGVERNTDAVIFVAANGDDEFVGAGVDGGVDEGHLRLLADRDEFVLGVDEHPAAVEERPCGVRVAEGMEMPRHDLMG